MQAENQIRKDELKLDNVLRLIFYAEENKQNLLGLFHDRHGFLFLGDLSRLENMLFQDGLIQYMVSAEGLEICLTVEGREFLRYGGYGSDPAAMVYPKAMKVRNKKNFRLNLMVAGVFFLMLLYFIIFNK